MNELKVALKEILVHEMKNNNGVIDLESCLSKIFNKDEMEQFKRHVFKGEVTNGIN